MLRRGRRRGIGHETFGHEVEERLSVALAAGRGGRAAGARALPPADRGREQARARRLRSGHRGRPRRRGADPRRARPAWPDSPIQGEEEGFTPGASEWSWIIDPIDGTRAFISGVPAWGILLGLLKAGRPVAGIMRQPYLDETFLGGPSGAWLLRAGSRLPLRASGRTSLGEAILYSTHPRLFADPAEQAGFDRVSAAVRMTRFGGDCYSYCLLAHGFVDLVIEGALQAYDIVPLIPIVEAAGGIVTGLDGEPPLAGGTVIAAASPALHAQALALMRGPAHWLGTE